MITRDKITLFSLSSIITFYFWFSKYKGRYMIGSNYNIMAILFFILV